MMYNQIAPAVIDYTNGRGERARRNIKPIRIFYGTTEHHVKPQWLLEAWDSDKQALRVFGMNYVKDWS